PVEPDVNTTYAVSSAVPTHVGRSDLVGASGPASTTWAVTPSGHSRSFIEGSTSTTRHSPSVTTVSCRSSGAPASSGKYAAPVSPTAMVATTCSVDLSMAMPTRCPGPIPRSRNCHATAQARSYSSP